MTNTYDTLRRIEAELHSERTLSEVSKDEVRALQLSRGLSVVSLLSTISASIALRPPIAAATASNIERVSAIRLVLVSIGLDSGDPRWSSALLDRLLSAIMETKNGSVGDLLHATYDVLGDYLVPLTKPVAEFIKEVVVGAFSRYRSSYDSLDWRWICDANEELLLPSRAYFAYHVLPPAQLSSPSKLAILKGLAVTSYWQEGVLGLQEDLQDNDSRILFHEWLKTNVDPLRAKDIRSILKI
jgi:hypothetical protein